MKQMVELKDLILEWYLYPGVEIYRSGYILTSIPN